MPKKKTGQRKKHEKMKARQKEIRKKGDTKNYLFDFYDLEILAKAIKLLSYIKLR